MKVGRKENSFFKSTSSHDSLPNSSKSSGFHHEENKATSGSFYVANENNNNTSLNSDPPSNTIPVINNMEVRHPRVNIQEASHEAALKQFTLNSSLDLPYIQHPTFLNLSKNNQLYMPNFPQNAFFHPSNQNFSTLRNDKRLKSLDRMGKKATLTTTFSQQIETVCDSSEQLIENSPASTQNSIYHASQSLLTPQQTYNQSSLPKPYYNQRFQTNNQNEQSFQNSFQRHGKNINCNVSDLSKVHLSIATNNDLLATPQGKSSSSIFAFSPSTNTTFTTSPYAVNSFSKVVASLTHGSFNNSLTQASNAISRDKDYKKFSIQDTSNNKINVSCASNIKGKSVQFSRLDVLHCYEDNEITHNFNTLPQNEKINLHETVKKLSKKNFQQSSGVDEVYDSNNNNIIIKNNQHFNKADFLNKLNYKIENISTNF